MKIQNSKEKIIKLRAALEWRKKLSNKKLKLVFTNGCFDLIHRGHAEYLLKARNMGDALIVALNSDSSIRKLKGSSRPVCKEDDRAFTLASFSFVDAVILFNGERCDNLIRTLKPDIYVKGGDYNLNTIDSKEKKALLECGAEIKFIKFIKGLSTTSLIEKLNIK